MRIILWFVLFTSVIYAGNVIGICILCETFSELKRIKSLAWYIPILNCLMFFSIVFKMEQKEKITLFEFIRVPHKNIIAAYVVNDCLKEMENSDKHRVIVKESISSYGRAIALKAAH